MGEKEKNYFFANNENLHAQYVKQNWTSLAGKWLLWTFGTLQIVYLHLQLPAVRASFNYAKLVMMVIASHFYARIWK